MIEKIHKAKMMDDPNRDRPSLAFYHPNGKGTGCALKVMLHPATDISDGYLGIRMASQATVGNLLADPHSYPTFDWENCQDFYLDVESISKVLMVLRGEVESIDDGKGLYSHRIDTDTMLRLMFSHVVDPVQGYSMELTTKCKDESDDQTFRIFLSPSESLGFAYAIEHGIGLMCFGLHPKH